MICILPMSCALAPSLLIFERWTLCQVLANVLQFVLSPVYHQKADQSWVIVKKEAVDPGCRSTGDLAEWLDLSQDLSWMPSQAQAAASQAQAGALFLAKKLMSAQPCLRNYTIDKETFGKDKCAWNFDYEGYYCSTVPNPDWADGQVWRKCICDKYEVRP